MRMPSKGQKKTYHVKLAKRSWHSHIDMKVDFKGRTIIRNKVEPFILLKYLVNFKIIVMLNLYEFYKIASTYEAKSDK